VIYQNVYYFWIYVKLCHEQRVSTISRFVLNNILQRKGEGGRKWEKNNDREH
jgi:hypothetical protein